MRKGIPKSYTCSSCHNNSTIKEGFVIKTKQCKACQLWDDTKDQRNEAIKQYTSLKITYVAGDPFW